MNRKQLKSHAGAAAFGRGEGYYESGRVGNLRFHTHGVQAKVSGQHVYQVRLDWSDGFDYRCNCPMGEQGDCCKHCVAVGFAWLNRDKKQDIEIESEDARIRNWLESREKQALIGIIMEASESDEVLFKRLSLKASASSLDLNALKQSIRTFFKLRKFSARRNASMRRWRGRKKALRPLPPIPILDWRNIWRSCTSSERISIRPLPSFGTYSNGSHRCTVGRR